MFKDKGEIRPPVELPESRGKSAEIAQVRFEIEMAKRMLMDGGEFRVDVALPFIVGWLPPSEHELLSRYVPTHMFMFPAPNRLRPEEEGKQRPFKLKDFRDFRANFPKFSRIVQSDIRKLKLKPDIGITFDRHTSPAGVQHRPGPEELLGWHVDDGFIGDVSSKEEHDFRAILGMSYIVWDEYAPEFYSGAADFSVTGEVNEHGSSRQMAVSWIDHSSGLIMPAPPRAVVRVTPLTVHRSPFLVEEATRAFSQIHAGHTELLV